MKLLMVIGGLLGFVISLVIGLVQSSAWPSVLWRASAAALVAGILMRWWGRIWLTNLQQVTREHLVAQMKSKAAASPTQSKS
ncbi:MAG: hypothetical protein AAB676_08595 [Verrucomicrobiota bacterium]